MLYMSILLEYKSLDLKSHLSIKMKHTQYDQNRI